MKKTTILLVVALMVLMIPLFGAGSYTTEAVRTDHEDGWIEYTWTGEIDSLEALTATKFIDLDLKYNTVIARVFEYKLTKDSSGDTLNVAFLLYGSQDGTNKSVIDTLATGTTETWTLSEPDFNDQTRMKYQVTADGGTGNYNDVTFEFHLWFFIQPIYDYR